MTEGVRAAASALIRLAVRTDSCQNMMNLEHLNSDDGVLVSLFDHDTFNYSLGEFSSDGEHHDRVQYDVVIDRYLCRD